MLVIPYARIDAELEDELDALGTLNLFLFVANVTPDGNTTIGTLSAGVPAWADVQAMSGRTGPTAVSTERVFTWDDVVFTNSTGSAVNVYGYVVSNAGKSVLHWSERNSAAPVSVGAGQTYTVTPRYGRKAQT